MTGSRVTIKSCFFNDSNNSVSLVSSRTVDKSAFDCAIDRTSSAGLIAHQLRGSSHFGFMDIQGQDKKY
jgi:hypothetical protein